MRLHFRPLALTTAMAMTLTASAAAATMAAPAASAATTAKPAVTATSTLWKARFDSSNQGTLASSVAVSPDGSTVYVTGSADTQNASGPQWATIAYDAASGAQRWIARYDGGPGRPAVAVSPDGSKVFVTGTVNSVSAESAPVTLAYNASTGKKLWIDDPNVQDFASPAALTVSADGATVYVVGWAGQPNQDVYEVFAINAATGAPRWTGTHTFDSDAESFPTANIVVSPDGAGVFITGVLGTVGFNTSTGAELWSYSFPDGLQQGNSIAVSPDSSTVYVGGRYPLSPESAYWTVAYNAVTGAQIWSSLYPGLGASQATSLAVAPNGSAVFVTGTTEAAPTPHGMRIVTLAYNPATGAQLWAASYQNETPDVTEETSPSLAVTPDSSTVAVTGARAVNGGPQQFVTLAYRAGTGTRTLASVYTGPGGHNLPTAIAVSPDSSTVFTTGESAAASGRLDYETIANRL